MLISKLLGRCPQLSAAASSHKIAVRLFTDGPAAAAVPPTSQVEYTDMDSDVYKWLDNVDLSKFTSHYGQNPEAWVESLASKDLIKIKTLNKDIFAVYPRLDIIHSNLVWQNSYNKINYAHALGVKEMIHWYGGGGKPWQQKGTGRARHGSTRSPQWVQGGKAHGPRGPKSNYYMLSYHLRVYGLTHTLTMKFIQDDIHIVKDLEIPTDDPQYVLDLIESRGWGMSTLIVDNSDIFPTNITAATDDIRHVNLMPVYGLNVKSMLKHETLVLTESAVDQITKKIIFALNRTDVEDRKRLNSQGPTEQKLKLEQHRPLL